MFEDVSEVRRYKTSLRCVATKRHYDPLQERLNETSLQGVTGMMLQNVTVQPKGHSHADKFRPHKLKLTRW